MAARIPLPGREELDPAQREVWDRVVAGPRGTVIGPLRAAVPLAAGACEMPRFPFHVANWSSAFVWAAVTLAPGALGAEWLTKKLGWG